MGTLRTITDDAKLAGKRVLLRGALDVPLEKTARGGLLVADDFRLQQLVSTIVRLAKARARIVLVGHIGRPHGRRVASLSLRPVISRLQQLLPPEVGDISFSLLHDFGLLAKRSKKIELGHILALENLRFFSGEEANNPAFAKQLASLGDVYVNECFSNSHRAHASMLGVAKLLPAYAGWQLARELKVLEDVRSHPKKPFVLLMGGIKMDKLPVLTNLAPHTSAILLGGGLANTFLQIQKIPVGKSAVGEKVSKVLLRKLLKEQRRFFGRGMKALIHLPKDVVVAKSPTAMPRLVDLENGEKVKAGEIIYDIGPKTVLEYATIIKAAATIVWNGPVGMFEKPVFAQGSRSLGWLIAARSEGPAFGVVGGGDTLEVLKSTGMESYVDYRSTGGGAMTTLLAGKELAAVPPLYRKQ
ncbi:phosphoglycerate kinase [Candidatus Uhrbacteria bacterium CG10_big_fil_rev_8_21_14_0_10_48_11]|uniref:Phosphoglycerate kinase n=1 Tax=Candidatus Uhrbacteria bacterium CG10_big_fil_rev_8_21_14_0_10_48_11 TaxID=1975037 RepID=A0A2M8LDU9_9BACT|nr:MAG: phosphoglycerate kinase [Candidatus Uhrbacteria bacterium CG10_big_fil_rev_8_21_14_0_10_48_11]